jgi:hypothetical protein
MVFLSCNKTLENPIEPESSSIEKIHEDVIFQEFVLDIQRQAGYMQNINTLQQYLKDGELSDYEKETIHGFFGYNDKKLFWSDQTRRHDRLVSLTKKYNLSNATNRQKELAIEKTFIKLGLFSEISLTNRALRAVDPCETIRRNCIGSVAAQAAVMHIGCAALDISVIGGIICHAAAFTYQYTAGNNCNAEAEKCNNQ